MNVLAERERMHLVVRKPFGSFRLSDEAASEGNKGRGEVPTTFYDFGGFRLSDEGASRA